jgi:hypothetical protein
MLGISLETGSLTKAQHGYWQEQMAKSFRLRRSAESPGFWFPH